MRYSTQACGFTLIELMVVVSIIGILAAIAIPSYQSYSKRARFTEVITAAEPFKIAVSLALQEGMPQVELQNGAHGIPPKPYSTKNLANLSVENGVITGTSTVVAGGATYILKPSADGGAWTISGSCVKAGLCEG